MSDDIRAHQRERFRIALGQFLLALARLEEVVVMADGDIVRDATIQRFEFTYETAWKALFYWLQMEGEAVPRMVRPVLRAAFTAQLIDDPEVWERIKDSRDQTSHAYDAARALVIVEFVRAQAVHAFRRLAETLERS